MRPVRALIFAALFTLGLLNPVVHAQFNFFDQMFGHQQHQNQQHHEPSGTPQWSDQSEHVKCLHYLCPATLVCVPNPVDCPCPVVQDVKCTIPDAIDKGTGTVICVRGGNGCTVVEKLAHRK